ncbi:MAG: thrombospondin type 3 repeat-containing protein [Anaerolineales bacterium]|nr:thrombospondin type 3 repeat-containing protein [Anaerolineales bacterium]
MKALKTCVGVVLVIAVALAFLGLIYLGVGYLQRLRRQAAAPQIRILSPEANATIRVGIPLTVQAGAAAQGGALAKLQFYADGWLAGEQVGAGDTLLGTWAWAAGSEGLHALTFVAYNQQGDTSLQTIQVTAVPAADRDGDVIPDELDECPDQPGPAASRGCLLSEDRDGDGLVDSQDACPETPGDPAEAGCPPDAVPDRDRDGVPDGEDRCPDQPGLPEWAGCPAGAWVTDSDGDGLPDFLDRCPLEAGPREDEGCPSASSLDADGDGVPDSDDACVDRAGPVEGDGCPLSEDRDGDGIPDGEDACPDEAGVLEEGGCLPEEGLVDTDGDGVLDDYDLCPDEAGPLENDGCPLPEDRDGDGVLDGEDSCPDEPGPASNRGCPYLPLDIIERAGISLFTLPSDWWCRVMPSLCDRDGDGVLNAEDGCPDQAGPVEFAGCPAFPGDQDGDGVLDAYDACLTEVGDPALLGCPDEYDLDADGLPYALDACPDVPGPVENHGCPRIGHRVNVEVELMGLSTDTSWVGVYCYLNATGLGRMVRVPESGLLGITSPGSWDLPDDRRRKTIQVEEDGALFAQVLCWGMPGDPAILPQSLGEVYRNHGYEAWDSQIRHARGEGGGGWFELTYRLCRGSCR